MLTKTKKMSVIKRCLLFITAITVLLRNKRALRYAIFILCLTAALVAIYARYRLHQAEEFLNGVDLEARQVSGAIFFANPKRLFVGQALSRNDVVYHLITTNFTQTDTQDQLGSYHLIGANSLHITPRFKEFQPVTVTFKGNHISSINVEATPYNHTAGEVQEAAIEPEMLGSFIKMIDENSASRMYVRRYVVQPAEVMDTDLFYAALASEDAAFMSHHGVSYSGYLRSAKNYIWNVALRLLTGRKSDRIGGASTISSQVIKNAVSMDARRSFSRKLDELFLTAALERRMSKEKIFALYANSVYLGGGKGSPNVYGFMAAAEEYYGKRNLKELTLNEACTLVAMLPQPNFFLDKAKEGDYEILKKWRDRVLDLLNYNWPSRYTREKIETVKQEPVRFIEKRPYQDQPIDIISQGFIEYASKLQPLFDFNNLPITEYSGLHIYLSIDPDLMRESQRIISNKIPAIESKFPPAVKGGCKGENDRMLATIIALDPKTGDVISMYGGAGGKDGAQYAKFALNARGAPGSLVKPLWTTLALLGGRLTDGSRYTAASVIDPRNASIAGWHPRIGVGEKGRVRRLLSGSRDDFATFTLDKIGLRNGADFYETLTGAKIEQPVGLLAIGFGSGTEVSPLQMARAYSIYGNNGSLVEPFPLTKVFLDGEEVQFRRQPSKRVTDEGAAFITVQMLRSVLGYGIDGQVGTARRAFKLSGVSPNIQIAGKTASGPSDVWMVSISPKLIIVTWLGYQCHSEIKNYEKLYSADTVAVIWAEFLKSVNKFRPDLLAGSFEKPKNVDEIGINPQKGCRTDKPGNINEFFIEDTGPMPCDSNR